MSSSLKLLAFLVLAAILVSTGFGAIGAPVAP